MGDRRQLITGASAWTTVAKLQQMQQWLLVVYAVSLPLTMTGSWALLTAGVIAWAVESGLRRFAKSPDDHIMAPTPLPLKWPLLAMAAAVTLSGLINPNDRSALAQGWHCFWALKALLIYFWASKVFHGRPSVAKWCFSILLCVSAVAGIWGTIQQRFNIHFGYPYLQGTGFLAGPMPFAGQMQVFSLLALGLFLTKGYHALPKPLNNKFVFALIVAANLSGLAFAFERSAWLGGLAAILVLTAMVSWRTFFKAVVALIVVGAIGWYAIPSVRDRIEPILSGQADVGVQSRLVVWQKAIEVWRSSPVFGVGHLNFPRLDIPEAIVPGISKDLNHAHSNILHFLATTGVLGAIAYVWLCISILLYGAKSYARARRKGDDLAAGFHAGTLSAMVSLMVSGLFEYNFGTAQVRLAQWLVLGLLSYEPRDSV